MTSKPESYDFVIIGGGIVGVATARQLQRENNDARVLIIEKEQSLARHQTGHNSGVIHAGVYYTPKSLKAEFCKRGAEMTFEFCKQHNIAVDQPGKLLVATNPSEVQGMYELAKRCEANEIEVHEISAGELKTLEPNITGLAALRVPASGIVDYKQVTQRMAELFTENGGEILLGHQATSLVETQDHIELTATESDCGSTRASCRTATGATSKGATSNTAPTAKRTIYCKKLIACAGLQADRVAEMIGISTDVKIIPYRGEYYQLAPKHGRLLDAQHSSNAESSHTPLVNHLIYPIPNPDLPFLGVHLTPMIDGSITIGPNAVQSFGREAYRKTTIDLADTVEMLKYPGFWKVAQQHWRSGLGELRDSISKRGYLKRVQKYCPSLQVQDLRPYPAGVRAQAVKANGELVHDFYFANTKRSLHVLNAPSPAATSAMPIAEHIVAELAKL